MAPTAPVTTALLKSPVTVDASAAPMSRVLVLTVLAGKCLFLAAVLISALTRMTTGAGILACEGSANHPPPMSPPSQGTYRGVHSKNPACVSGSGSPLQRGRATCARPKSAVPRGLSQSQPRHHQEKQQPKVPGVVLGYCPQRGPSLCRRERRSPASHQRALCCPTNQTRSLWPRKCRPSAKAGQPELCTSY